MSGVEQVTGPITHHGEGPMWDDAAATLYWVDMLAGDVLALTAGGILQRRHVARVAAAVRPRAGGGHVIAVERGFALTDPAWSYIRFLPEIWPEQDIRMNEGGCDPLGRFYCGSMAYDARPGAGALYRLDPDGSVSRVLKDVTCSNGLAWSPDGATAYYIDTGTQRIDRFDFAGGALAGRRPLVSIDPATGSPDGMTVDSEGCLWVAIWQGGAVHRYTPAGELAAVIEVPTPQVTACAFGGPDLTQLYITTSGLRLDGADPLAGAVFVAAPGVAGLPTAAFAG